MAGDALSRLKPPQSTAEADLKFESSVIDVEVQEAAWADALRRAERSAVVEITEQRATSALPQILNEDMAKAHAADAEISRAILYIRRGQPPNRTERKAEEQGTRRLLKDFHRLTLDGGVLHRETRSPEAHQRQIILPAVFRKAAIIKLHDEMGHQG